jgi:single-stranded DNA-specific DHH superfamily exonuclease
MLTEKQVEEIREHLEKAQNPVFFFDNDPDGLCSFLLLQRFIGRGKGVAVRSYPDLNQSYFRRVDELKADYIFILDKPVVSKDFFDEVGKRNIPCVWIDHHEINEGNDLNFEDIPEFVNYYNPVYNKEKTSEPVTALCYQISNKRDDLWLAVIGCIADWYIPPFYEEFKKDYPELYLVADTPPDILYKNGLGKIIRILSFGLKDSITNIVAMLKFLMKAKSPHDILEENSQNKNLHKKYNEIYDKFMKFYKKAEEIGKESGNILYFKYAGDSSMSADLANELSYNFPDKVIVVAYLKGGEGKANISVRGKKIRDKVVDAVSELEGATGGGHEDAAGARVRIEDLEKFKELIEDSINVV